MGTLLNLPNKKLFNTLENAVQARKQLQATGQKLVLTNGCFDLLHVGHISYLKEAASLGDQLWIALNSDESVRSLKGKARPVQDELSRAYMLAALESISGVLIFNNKRLNNEIEALAPDVYAKARDYTLETLDPSERNALESVNAEIHFLPFLPGFSTTNLISKIAAAESATIA